MSPGDVYKSLTMGALLEADESLLVQREQARFGITLVVIAFAFQSVNSFVRDGWRISGMVDFDRSCFGICVSYYPSHE